MSHTFSEQPRQSANRWFHQCLEQHSACNRERLATTWYPTRLLWLQEPSQSHDSIRLIETAKEAPSGPYATLSHCWGGASFLQLKKTSLSTFCAGIPTTELPKTFQEAILVARFLGISYIWIDSLCIMQDKDDLSDWYREAASMDRVYMHSLCNISATDAKDGSHGLFRNRDLHHVRQARAKVCVTEFQCPTKYVDCIVHDLSLQRASVRNSVLGQRGWVLQETVLAPRVLHFAAHQLFWECREHAACERYPGGFPEDFGAMRFKVDQDYGARDQDASGTRHDVAHASTRPDDWRGWSSLISAYTSMSLTCPSDKLIALSGIAKQYAARYDDTYVAGMWRKKLLHQLLWFVTHNATRMEGSLQTHPTVYRAPSWSWAAIDCRVQQVPDDFYSCFLFQVEDVGIVHATNDTTGGILKGWLDLKAQLKPTQLLWRRRRDVYNTDVYSWHMVINDVEETWCEGIRLDKHTSDERAFDGDNANSRLFYMPAGRVAHKIDYHAIRFLLFRVLDVDQGIYERLGCGYQYGDELVEIAMLADADEDVKKGVPCVRYEDGMHTIRVI
jgi:hypothetical protein